MRNPENGMVALGATKHSTRRTWTTGSGARYAITDWLIERPFSPLATLNPSFSNLPSCSHAGSVFKALTKQSATGFGSHLRTRRGTNTFKTNNKSSQARPLDRVCYGSLLRFWCPEFGLKYQRSRQKHSARLLRFQSWFATERHEASGRTLITGGQGYIFPAFHTPLRPMSENTINLSFRRMGNCKDDMTAHEAPPLPFWAAGGTKRPSGR